MTSSDTGAGAAGRDSARGEQPTDTMFRTRAITAVRGGKDPSTDWKVKNSSIGSLGGAQ